MTKSPLCYSYHQQELMTAQFLQRGPTRTSGQHSQGKDWVILTPNQNIHNRGDITTALHQTKLLFNEAIPASAHNRATRVGPPAPIVIEKLIPRLEEQENVDSTRSSMSFSAVSEERLLAAVRLAKRDLRRRRHQSLNNSLVDPPQEDPAHDTKNDLLQQNEATIKIKSKASSPKKKTTQPGTKLLVHTPQKHSISSSFRVGQSPPTRDPGPGQLAKGRQPQLSQEIQKLQNELGVYIQKIEKLANRGHITEDPLEPDERRRMEIRRQKQADRSARIIYVLQQQVKEIQEDIEKLRSQKNWEAKKSSAIDRLAAAHRGAVRAMQVSIHQLSEPSEVKVPSHCKELGQLIRQLSLCSAKVEVDQGSAVPETALDILQKLETLDSALNKQERPWQRQARARSSSPPRRKSPHRSVSPACAPRGPATSRFPRPRKAPGPGRSTRGRRTASQNPRVTSVRPKDRSRLLRAGLQSLVQQRELREEARQESEPNATYRRGGALHPERSKIRDAGFRQPTVASRLRVNQLPQKEQSVPWIPTSPHSPPLQRRSPQRRRPEPRCLFSPLKPPPSNTEPKVTRAVEAEQALRSDKEKQAQNEALRQAWLDRMTMQRLKELNQLSKEEVERIQRLRSEVGSPTQWAERAEQKAREKIQPLLDEAQIGESRNRNSSFPGHRLSEQAAERAAESAEQLSEALLEDLLDDAARAAWAAEADRQSEGVARDRLQAPTLESMLLRMEEMQRDQEEVRRRFATIAYSDPLSWDRVEARGPRYHAAGSRPTSPQPIRLTRPVLRHCPAAEIVLEKPVETGVLSESSLTEDGSQDARQPASAAVFPGGTQNRGTLVSVPGSMLNSIRKYREDMDAYLRFIAHEPVGSFNPWAIADSLAEELMSEALADVAAEFQDVCEEYAEAVFTSEFLQPIQSPPTSLPLLGSQ